jgi:hypothetical protein
VEPAVNRGHPADGSYPSYRWEARVSGSGLSDHERDALAQIERALACADKRLARRLARPGPITRWRFGAHRDYLVALIVLLGLSLIPITIALIQ